MAKKRLFCGRRVKRGQEPFLSLYRFSPLSLHPRKAKIERRTENAIAITAGPIDAIELHVYKQLQSRRLGY